MQSYCSQVDLSHLLRADEVSEAATSNVSLVTPDSISQPVVSTVSGLSVCLLLQNNARDFMEFMRNIQSAA